MVSRSILFNSFKAFFLLGLVLCFQNLSVAQVPEKQDQLTGLNPLCNCEINLIIKPNPAKDNLSIKHTIPNGAKIEIYNITGKVYFSKQIEMETEISVQSWPNGLYWITLSIGKDREETRVTKRLAIL